MTTTTELGRSALADEREYKMSEAAWLMSFRTHPEEIAARLGTTLPALNLAARREVTRAGNTPEQVDRAQQVASYTWTREKQDVCVDCGEHTSSVKVARCRPCTDVHRWTR